MLSYFHILFNYCIINNNKGRISLEFIEMLNFLSQANQKQIVGIALNPGIGLEIAILDKSNSTVINYGRKKVDYNFSTREIQDYVQFKTALVELMDLMKIQPKSLAYLVLPNVYFDFIEVPIAITNSEIKTAILSKAEEFYIFKREEPISGWCQVASYENTSQKKIVYSSFQKSAIEELKEILSDVGLQLTGIETSYSATLRGLYLTGQIDDVILENSPWTAMIVGTNSYALLQMEGKNLLDYSEVPIAIKSFSTEEAYQAIVSSSAQLINNHNINALYIISQTDDICAEVLKHQMQFDKEIHAIDSNKFSKKPLLEVVSTIDYSQVNPMTLSVLGAAHIKSNFDIILNVLADDPNASMGVYFTANILGTPVDITNDLVLKVSIMLSVIFFVIFGGIALICATIDSKEQEKIAELSSKLQKVNAEILSETDGKSKQEIDISTIIDEIAAMNVSAINFYDSIATDIPKNVWLTQYYNTTGDKIVVRGVAQSIIDIYEYYKNLRIVSPKSDIKLTELKVITEDLPQENKYLSDIAINKDTERLYSFEIANTQIQYETAQKDKSVRGKNANAPQQIDYLQPLQENENEIIIKTPLNNIENTSGMKPAK